MTMDFQLPDLLQIETTTACNATCLMCPRDVATRSTHSERMKEDVFWETVRQAHEEMGINLVVPFMDGEPLADSRMVDFVEGCAKRWPRLELGWFTNGSLLTEERATRLLKAGNIKRFNVSMQGGNKETYERTMGLPWERTVRNMERLLEINLSLGKPAEVIANMVVFGATSDSQREFQDRWRKLGATVCLSAFSNFGGLSKDDKGENPWKNTARKVCHRAVRHLYVFWNGDVGQCCYDLVGSAIYGNVERHTLREIWFNEKSTASRRAHYAIDESGMAPICQKCNAPRFQS